MSTGLKVVLAIALVIGGALAMLAVAGVFFARTIHVHESGTGSQKTVSIDTPVGHFGVHANDELNPEQVGIPVYPGASRSGDKGGAEFQLDSGDLHKEINVSGATYLTPDSPDKVRAFYQRKFPSWDQKWENGEFKLDSKEDGRIRTVMVKPENGGSRIAVASIGTPAAN